VGFTAAGIGFFAAGALAAGALVGMGFLAGGLVDILMISCGYVIW